MPQYSRPERRIDGASTAQATGTSVYLLFDAGIRQANSDLIALQ